MSLKSESNFASGASKLSVSLAVVLSLSFAAEAWSRTPKPPPPQAPGVPQIPGPPVETVGKDGGTMRLPKGEIQLPAGWKHQRLQGIDSTVGRIFKDDGPKVSYSIGRIPKPGGPRFGGDFTNGAARLPEKDRESYEEKEVAGQPVNIAVSKKSTLHVTYPKSGLNFFMKAKSKDEIDAVRKILLTYRDAAVAKKE